MNRKSVLNTYPWLYDDSPKNVIMGDDLDSGLSTLLYLLNNPNATLVGIYTNYNKIFFSSKLSKRDLENCVYLDLDIYQKNCRSLGHHIVRISSADILGGFHSSCNLNELENRSVTNQFVRKYPLGTIHFLIWLYDTMIPNSKYAENLIWLADSSFINGQSHRFRNNVSDWVNNLMISPQLHTGFLNIDTENFEYEIEQLQNLMLQSGLIKGSGQVTSKYKKLTGFQCQPNGNEDEKQIIEYVKNLLQFISNIVGWDIPKNRLDIENLTVLKGIRRSGNTAHVLNGQDIDSFLLSNNIFSYVFPFRDNINYTTNIL